MEENEKQTYKALRPVITNFMGNKKGSYYKNIVGDMFEKFQKLGCNISLKIPFLYSHLDYFLQSARSRVRGFSSRYQRDVKMIPGTWNMQIIANYCWLLKRDDPQQIYKKKVVTKRHFVGKRKCVYKAFWHMFTHFTNTLWVLPIIFVLLVPFVL